jgi:hypothetical protein
MLLQEIVAFDMGIVRFAEVLRQEIATRYGGCEIIIFGDPAGDFRAQTDETTPFQIMRGAGLSARPAPSNDVALRLESVSAPLNRMIEGQSGLLIDQRCRTIIKGFEGGYQYKRMQVSGERYADKPDKNHFSHIHDALQYLMLGSGEGRQILRNNSTATKPFQATREFDVFTRKPKVRREGLWSRM